jgi:hypothetical protein
MRVSTQVRGKNPNGVSGPRLASYRDFVHVALFQHQPVSLKYA